jgi:hypothetical protein
MISATLPFDPFAMCGNVLVVCKVVEFLLLLSTYDVCTVVYRICCYRHCLWEALENVMDQILFNFP